MDALSQRCWLVGFVRFVTRARRRTLLSRAPAFILGVFFTSGLFTSGCAATVYQPLRSLQRPVILNLNEANFEGLIVQVRCPAGPLVEAGDARKACRKIEQLFANQGAVIDAASALAASSAARPDLIIDVVPRVVSDDPDRLNSFFCVMTLSLWPCVTDISFTEDITVRDGDGTLLVSDSLVARFVTYNGVAVYSVNALLDVFARPASDALTTDAQYAVFSRDFYGQLSQLAFHARTRSLVLRNFERAK